MEPWGPTVNNASAFPFPFVQINSTIAFALRAIGNQGYRHETAHAQPAAALRSSSPPTGGDNDDYANVNTNSANIGANSNTNNDTNRTIGSAT
jgi:hypothetical protein